MLTKANDKAKMIGKQMIDKTADKMAEKTALGFGAFLFALGAELYKQALTQPKKG